MCLHLVPSEASADSLGSLGKHEDLACEGKRKSPPPGLKSPPRACSGMGSQEDRGSLTWAIPHREKEEPDKPFACLGKDMTGVLTASSSPAPAPSQPRPSSQDSCSPSGVPAASTWRILFGAYPNPVNYSHSWIRKLRSVRFNDLPKATQCEAWILTQCSLTLKTVLKTIKTQKIWF